jgi:hypothetical protein
MSGLPPPSPRTPNRGRFPRSRGANDRAANLRQMRLAAHSVDGVALFGELHRPAQCWLRSVDHEPRFAFFPRRFRFRSGPFFHRLSSVPDTRQSDARAHRRAAVDILHHRDLGFGLGIERVGARAGKLLRLAFSLRRGRSRTFPRHDILPHAMVPADLSRALHGDLHNRHSACEHHWRAALRLHSWNGQHTWLS